MQSASMMTLRCEKSGLSSFHQSGVDFFLTKPLSMHCSRMGEEEGGGTQ